MKSALSRDEWHALALAIRELGWTAGIAEYSRLYGDIDPKVIDANRPWLEGVQSNPSLASGPDWRPHGPGEGRGHVSPGPAQFDISTWAKPS